MPKESQMSAGNAVLVFIVFMISSTTPSFMENGHTIVLNVAESLREEMCL